MTRKTKIPTDEAASLVHGWMELFPMAASDRCTLCENIAPKNKHGFGFWDAMLVEAARASWVTRLITDDMQDGRKVVTLRLENSLKGRFGPASPARRVAFVA